ncbi:D-Tyr tRNAtyr deacylase-like domain-containing protein [Vararia minispora EC-137]|uniref:D-Tyr tRNAtyr deacylase-like domain-containing protein n=1 Tax=Vararia minispora EC-137 TaxID=1314806 RepID=A0ACB8Q4W2_9AGAM|nr:D-Tyr tRNAtyr deacylase-like domain-containing protein [Vararia minispora EC-137]
MPADIEVLAKKILSLRIFDDASGSMWKASVKDIDGEVLCVSQFTLMANTSKGNKPDFHNAMGPVTFTLDSRKFEYFNSADGKGSTKLPATASNPSPSGPLKDPDTSEPRS